MSTSPEPKPTPDYHAELLMELLTPVLMKPGGIHTAYQLVSGISGILATQGAAEQLLMISRECAHLLNVVMNQRALAQQAVLSSQTLVPSLHKVLSSFGVRNAPSKVPNGFIIQRTSCIGAVEVWNELSQAWVPETSDKQAAIYIPEASALTCALFLVLTGKCA